MKVVADAMQNVQIYGQQRRHFIEFRLPDELTSSAAILARFPKLQFRTPGYIHYDDFIAAGYYHCWLPVNHDMQLAEDWARGSLGSSWMTCGRSWFFECERDYLLFALKYS